MSTKRKIAAWATLVCLIAFAVWAANPSFSDFLTTQFGVSGNRVAIKSGANITNAVLSGLYPGVTNVTLATDANGFLVGATNVDFGGLVVNSNAYFYTTNFLNWSFTTNLYVSQFFETVSNSYFLGSNFFNYGIVTNLTVINNFDVQSNVNFFSTNFVNNEFVTNLTVVNNIHSGTNFFDNLTVTNGITNLSLNASEYVVTDGNKRLTTLPGTVVTNNASFAVLSQSPTANGPSGTELVTANWVRGLFNNGIIDYSSSVIDNTATNNDSTNVVYTFFQGVIPPSAIRSYTAVTNDQYIGSVITTNRFSFLQGPVNVNAWLERAGGLGGPTATVHPELYYSYDKTNWFGDWEAANQTISTGTNLYQFVVTFPAITATNTAGFYIERRFKIGVATGSTHPNVIFHIGTNSFSGTGNASHIAFAGPNSAAIGAAAVIDFSWSGPTNLVSYTNGTLQSYTTLTPISVTSLENAVAGQKNEVLLCITNSSSSNITVLPPTGWKVGYGETTPWTITNADIGEFWFLESNNRKTVTGRGFH